MRILSDMAFFSIPAEGKAPSSLIPKCGECGLYKGCDSPKMTPTGEGHKKVLIVAEAPGKDEDQQGIQLVGSAGRKLRKILRSLDIDLDEDCWKTNSLICRPPKNRAPTKNEIRYCRPNLLRTISDFNPVVIIPMGSSAVESVIEHSWGKAPGPVSQWAGWQIPDQLWNVWICPTFHPSYLLRSEGDSNYDVIELWFRRHLESAFSKSDRPWETRPDHRSQVQVVSDVYQAAQRIDRIIEDGGPLSFDYETDRLKSDSKDASIVCCGISYKGEETFAYPWAGEAIRSTSRLLKADNPKIGANTKFEELWTRRVLGHGVNNWAWDTMLSAHHLDNRPGITSVEFQAYARFGEPEWGSHISPYLRSDDSQTPNQIYEADFRQLLFYCGMDALMEYKIAVSQRKEMKGHGS